MSPYVRYLAPLVAVATLGGLPTACGGGGELRDAAQAGGSFARIAVSFVHHHEDPPSQMQLETEALFVSYRNAEADGVEALLGTSPAGGELRRGECRTTDRQARFTAAFNPDGPDAEVVLLDAGEVQLRLALGPVSLAPRRYPELVPFVSGVYYGDRQPSADLDRTLGGDVLVLGSGGPEVGPFAASVVVPPDLPLAQVTPLRQGLDLRWTAGREPDGVRVEVRGARGDGSRILSCAAPDDGAFLVPAAALVELGASDVSVAVARIRRQPFSATGVLGGEIVVGLRDVTELGLSEVFGLGGEPRPRRAR
jgi:hypothetical protein